MQDCHNFRYKSSAFSSRISSAAETKAGVLTHGFSFAAAKLCVLGRYYLPSETILANIVDFWTRSASHALQVLPETQPVLPCLLRRLLYQGRPREAYSLAKRHASAPHFARSLEWLLFTSLEINQDSFPSPSKTKAKGSGDTARGPERGGAGPLLTSAAELLRKFPQV